MAAKSTTNTQVLEAVESHSATLLERLTSQDEQIASLVEKVDRQNELIAALVAMGGTNQQGNQRPANVADRGPDNLTDNQRNTLKQVIVRAILAGKQTEASNLHQQMGAVAAKSVEDFRPVNDWVGKWINWANSAGLPQFPRGMDADVLINTLGTNVITTQQQDQAPQAPTQEQHHQEAPQQEDLPPAPAQDADIPFPV